MVEVLALGGPRTDHQRAPKGIAHPGGRKVDGWGLKSLALLLLDSTPP